MVGERLLTYKGCELAEGDFKERVKFCFPYNLSPHVGIMIIDTYHALDFKILCSQAKIYGKQNMNCFFFFITLI
jgi:hypothetical protein